MQERFLILLSFLSLVDIYCIVEGRLSGDSNDYEY